MITKTRSAVLALTFLAGAACAEISSPPSEILAACETPGSSSASLTNDPILFVHGYAGNGGNWQVMKGRFLADGWQPAELYACNYSLTASNASSASEIAAQVDEIIAQTGATKVDIIAFSMGSISSRYYMKNLGGSAKIDAWVSLAGPNHGTDAVENNNCAFAPCQEIVPDSPFLAALNAVDETPGLARYGTWRSPCDATINPDVSVILQGATNFLTPCLTHQQMTTDEAVYQQVRAFVD